MKIKTKIKILLLTAIPFWGFCKLLSIRGTKPRQYDLDIHNRDLVNEYIITDNADIKKIMHSTDRECVLCQEKENIEIHGIKFSHSISVLDNVKCHFVCELEHKTNQE